MLIPNYVFRSADLGKARPGSSGLFLNLCQKHQDIQPVPRKVPRRAGRLWLRQAVTRDPATS